MHALELKQTFRKEKQNKRNLDQNTFPKYESWPMLLHWLLLWRNVLVLDRICWTSVDEQTTLEAEFQNWISHFLVWLGVWWIEKKVLHVTPHCRSHSVPAQSGASPGTLSISQLLLEPWDQWWAIFQQAQCQPEQHSFFIRTTSHHAFFPLLIIRLPLMKE